MPFLAIIRKEICPLLNSERLNFTYPLIYCKDTLADVRYAQNVLMSFKRRPTRISINGALTALAPPDNFCLKITILMHVEQFNEMNSCLGCILFVCNMIIAWELREGIVARNFKPLKSSM